jgi:hypothetical protein
MGEHGINRVRPSILRTPDSVPPGTAEASALSAENRVRGGARAEEGLPWMKELKQPGGR